MENSNWDKVETIIDKALALPAEQRRTFVDKECGDNADLKSEVTLILESIFDSDGWLENPEDYQEVFEDISNDLNQLNSHHDLIGLKIGSYTVREKLGEGGMGLVYLAERSDGAFKHKVAIKVIRHGSTTHTNIQRFKQERNILASMDHPGIARLYDGGVTEDGFPYLVMEYIDGTPIDKFCQDHQLKLDERIRLFKKVLQAVRHAHENLIIHRDLKPANILVTRDRAVKILDFGISKILNNDSAEPLTQTKSRLLTPRYAAPEQIKQQPVTTSTDLYALGIIFYRLLTGTHPFDLEELSPYETEQKILLEEPVPPSSHIKAPDLISFTQLRGDLDVISLKAIRKEPQHRYRVAGEFLEDLENYQENLPVSAHKNSVKYRSRKFISRHKKGLVVAAGIFLLMVLFAGFYTWRITDERNQAQLEAEKAEQISDFLVNMFRASNPIYVPSDTLTAYDFLERGKSRIAQLEDQPSIQAKLLSVIGQAYMYLGEYDDAKPMLNRSLELLKNVYKPRDPGIAEGVSQLAVLERKSGNFAVAESLHRNALAIRQKSFGKYHEKVASSLNDLGVVLQSQGRYSLADSVLQESMAIWKEIYGASHQEYARTLSNRASNYRFLGDYGKAEKLFEQTLAIWKKHYGLYHPRVAEGINDLALIYKLSGNVKEADSLYRKAIQVLEKIYEDKPHPESATTLNNLGVMLGQNGNFEESGVYLRKALRIRRMLYGDDHPEIAESLNNLARLNIETGNLRQAESLLMDALAIDKRKHGSNHPYVAGDLRNLGLIHQKERDYEKAEKYFRSALKIYDETLPQDHSASLATRTSLGEVFISLGNFTEAEHIFQKLLQIYRNTLPENHWKIGQAEVRLGEIKYKLAQYQSAEALLEDGFRILKENKKSNSQYGAKAQNYLTRISNLH